MSESTIRIRRPALGRGLSALIPTKPAAAATTETIGLLRLPIDKVHPNPDQPRQAFDEPALAELASSIKAHGLLQPIVVRRDGQGDFSIVAGERRWRAAQRVGLHEIAAVLSERPADDSLLLALVENLHRDDLNPLDAADAYRRLHEEWGLTQDEIAARLAKDRATIANAMRLLKLPPSVRELLRSGQISMGHARALLGLDDTTAIERVAREIVRKQLSVRDVERRVKLQRVGGGAPTARDQRAMSPALRDVTERLKAALTTRVVVKDSGRGRGSIEIAFGSYEELDRILSIICR
ncbi:MAG: ParB/RepB/Spo0J family partition protein [Deltaproteobacteria bacterium]|nr:ParB/RepB/Spo0J family partition protein [Deltaproteobacteria bacterium]